MKFLSPQTLNQELIVGFALVFTGALVIALVGAVTVLPRLTSPGAATAYLTVLLVADVAIFAVFARHLIRRRLLSPLKGLVDEAEAIAQGEYQHRLPPGGSLEVNRLADAMNRMAERLITHQQQLTDNIRSLEETNRQLTEARDELVRAEKMASVGRLAAGIAHEVGNPLGAIMGYLGLLKRAAEGKGEEWASAAETEAQRIDRIVRGLLDYARRRDARSRPIDVNDVIRETLELLSTQGQFGGVEVDLDLDQDVPPVAADPYQLEQVLVNLVLNACDAMDGRSARRLFIATASRRQERSVYLPARRRDDPPGVDYSHRRRFNRSPRLPRDNVFQPGAELVTIMVADTGPGIPTELLTQIFEPFVTTKEPGKGTGLGLAVSAGLIDAMGGTIKVENRDDAGAEFTVLLPATDSEIRAEES